jgi:poly(A) polymerase
VAFTDDWHEDAARRDFTMNALYADRHGALTDFFSGVDDARAGRVRFIGNPDRRIAEDALRILRFFRFHAWYGRGAIDPSGLAAVAAAAPGLDRLSGERIRDELLKLLRAPDPLPVWRAMTDVGVMAHLVPDANHIEDAVRLIAVEAALGLAADPLRRLAALTGLLDDERLATIRARLKLANRDGDWLAALATPRPQLGSLSDATFGAALYGAPPQQVCDAALIAYARSGRPDLPVIRALLDFASRWTEPRLPISGADIVARGVSPGPALGAVLGEVEAWWVAHNFNADRRECLEELDRRLRGGPRQ